MLLTEHTRGLSPYLRVVLAKADEELRVAKSLRDAAVRTLTRLRTNDAPPDVVVAAMLTRHEAENRLTDALFRDVIGERFAYSSDEGLETQHLDIPLQVRWPDGSPINAGWEGWNGNPPVGQRREPSGLSPENERDAHILCEVAYDEPCELELDLPDWDDLRCHACSQPVLACSCGGLLPREDEGDQ